MKNKCAHTQTMISITTPEKLRKIFLIKLFALIGMIFTLPFGILSLTNGKETLGQSLILITIILGINYFLVTKKMQYTLGSNIIVYLFLVLFIYLVYSGGVDQTGALWIYAFPSIALFLHGIKRGLIDISIFIILLTIILLDIENTIVLEYYSDEYKVRLILSFLLVTFLSSLYEYSSIQALNEMHLLTQKLVTIAKEEQLSELSLQRGIHEEIELLFRYAKNNDEELSIMVCDINYLHDIHSRYGDDVASMVIKEIEEEIQKSINNTDAFAVWTGDEFLILLPKIHVCDAQTFSCALEKRIINLKIVHDRQNIHMSVTTGVSDIKNRKSVYAAIRHADNQMY